MKRAKEKVRDELRAIRDGLDPVLRARASADICDILSGECDAVGAEVVASYVSVRSEVDLSELHRAWLERGGRLVLPRVVDDSTIELIEVASGRLDKLVRGRFGILEPVGEPMNLAEVDIVLVPGLGFDLEGGRMGYGAGYYDRLLQRIDEAKGEPVQKWGIAYSEQLIDAIPREPHDVVLDRVITERAEK